MRVQEILESTASVAMLAASLAVFWLVLRDPRQMNDGQRLIAGVEGPRPAEDVTLDEIVDGRAGAIGGQDARIALVEFSDFECPFCAKFHKETFPKINEEFISTGNVKFIVRDFPLESIHANAFKAAQVAKCAADQGKLWEMHDWLFAHQGQFSPEFFRHGRPIDLGEESFQQCLSSGKHDSVIRTS